MPLLEPQKTQTVCKTLEPLDDDDPDDDEERSKDARDGRVMHWDAEPSEVVYPDRGNDLPGQEQADGGRRAETRRENDRGDHVVGTQETAQIHPPWSTSNEAEIGHGAAY